MGDAEPLFLVDDQQTEIAELHIFRQQPMRADDDVDLAGGEIRDDLLLFGFRPKPTDHVDPHRKAREAVLERLLVLKGEDSRRREERHLLAVHHRLEGGAHGHFRLAVAHIAAEQPIHRRRRLHVVFDVRDRRFLIRCQLVLERALELLLPVRIGAERVSRDCLARRIELEQLFGHVAHGFLDLRLGTFPGRAAEPIDGRLCRAGVLLNEIEPLDGNEQFVVARIMQLDEFLLVVADADFLQANEDADAVVDVDDGIADLQIAEIRQKGFRGRPSALGRAPLLLEDVGFGVNLEARVGQPETARQASQRDEHGRVPRVLSSLDRRCKHFVFFEQLDRPLGASRGRRDEQNRLARVAQPADLGNPVRYAPVKTDRRLAAHAAG